MVMWTALAAGPVLAQSTQSMEPVRLRLGESVVYVPALVLPDGPYVSFKGFAAALGGDFQRDESAGRFRMAARGAVVEIALSMPALARVGDVTVSLGKDAVARDDDLFVAEGAVSRLLAAIEAASVQQARAEGRNVKASFWSLVGAGQGNLKLELVLPAEPSSVDVQRRRSGRHVVRVGGAFDLAPPRRRHEIGSSLVEAFEVDVRDDELIVTFDAGPRLADVRARAAPPGVEVLFVAAADEAKSGVEPAAIQKSSVSRVVIDPGHGGSEDGAIGPTGLKEKDLTLDVARRLRTLLQLEGFDVILTRDGDEDISLDDRAATANEYRADLFVSLHANASRFSGAYGAETFFLAPEATDDEARTLAALENNAARAQASRATDELPMILWDMAQVGYLEESARLAETIQARLNRLLDIRDRGVRQAPFRVLVGATCPAVLIELGFLTNHGEARRLGENGYRQQLTDALRDAISTFRREARGAEGIVVEGTR